MDLRPCPENGPETILAPEKTTMDGLHQTKHTTVNLPHSHS